MIMKKYSRMNLKKAVFGCFFVIMTLFGFLSNCYINTQDVYAVSTDESTSISEDSGSIITVVDAPDDTDDAKTRSDSCQSSLGAIGWLVCPTTGKIAEAIDGLYGLLENFLVINPVSAEEGTPVYEIWKYCRGLTNIAFIIFLLVVIYSQITGIVISNYGIKRVLPKLIIAAVLVNLSYLICTLAVDVSNVIGNSLRGLFASIGESAVVTGSDVASTMKVSYSDFFSSLAGGSALAIGGTVIAIESGAIWMLIPTVLGAIVAIVTGLITITLRQAVVVLLIMISPLAIVAYMLPNTESLFKKWKDLLIKMLVFYPMFSLLFGASNLAGFAIIASATSVFGIILGMAVQIFPLFFAWTLMKMSGTFLGAINQGLRGITSGPLARNRAWAESQKARTKAKNLASGRPTTPSLRLMQFMHNRNVAREAEISENEQLAKKRAMAYYRGKRYNKDGSSTKKGLEAYERQALGMQYDKVVLRDDNNMNKGLGELKVNEGSKYSARIKGLDVMNVEASDELNIEKARAQSIEFGNAKGFYNRMKDAIGLHADETEGYEIDANTGQRVKKEDYKFHFKEGTPVAKINEASARYDKINEIMEGNEADIQYAAAIAAHGYDTQLKMYATNFQKHFEMMPSSKNLDLALSELTTLPNASSYIDAIIPGLRVINQRGDTDVVLKHINNIMNSAEGLELGTHASQSLANFLMFDVKDSDPWLRRFGKYINLETARVYSKNERKELKVNYDEYVRGYHDEPDPDNPGQTKRMYAKKGMSVLMEGTSLDSLERTAFASLDESLKHAYTGPNGLDVDGYLKKRGEIQQAIGAQFNSASGKYLAGSEQLKNAVSFLTGYNYTQMKDPNTKEIILDDNNDPMYQWQSVWDTEDYNGQENKVRKYYRDKTKGYIESLTPTQILGMRSDYRDPMMEHLVDMFLEESPEGDEYRRRMSDVQTRYGDLSVNEAKKKRDNDMKNLKMEMAGKQMRKILGDTGKLAQIYRTRRSGAANGAKDWLRQWVSLDDEQVLLGEVKRYERARRERERRNNEVIDSGEPTQQRIYSDEDIENFVLNINNLYDNLNTDDSQAFYDESLDFIKNNLGEQSRIYNEYRRFHDDDPYADSDALKQFLEDMLRDSDNY